MTWIFGLPAKNSKKRCAHPQGKNCGLGYFYKLRFRVVGILNLYSIRGRDIWPISTPAVWRNLIIRQGYAAAAGSRLDAFVKIIYYTCFQPVFKKRPTMTKGNVFFNVGVINTGS